MSTTYVSVLCLSVAVLVAFASAQGYGNTIMISSEMPYVVSDVVAGGGLSVTWPGSRLINVVPSNGLHVQRIVSGGVRPSITQGGGIPLTIPIGMPSVMPGNGIPVLGGMPSSIPQVITGTGMPQVITGTGMPQVITGTGMPQVITGTGMPQVITGTGMPQVITGTGMPQVITGTGMPQMITGTGMPQVITGTGMPQVITGTGMQRIMPAVGMQRMMPGMGMPFMTGDMMDVLKDYYQTVGMMNMLGLGQSVNMNRHQYPAQRRAMVNKRTTSSSPSTEPVDKTKAIQRPI